MMMFFGVGVLMMAQALDPTIDTTVLTPGDFGSYHLVTWSVDYGDVQDEPLMHPAYEWDEEIGGKGTILVDPIDGLYKAWYISQPGIDYLTYNSSEGASRMVSYATSKDGVNWERPMLPIVKWNGSNTNLLLRLPDNREVSYACVFVNAGSKNVSETYEMLALLSSSPPGFKYSHDQVIYRYYSSDGVHWVPADEITDGPCAGGHWCSDSMYINKLADGSYQALLKHGSPSGAPPGGFVPYDIAAGNGRWIFVANSSNGKEWSTATLALSPDWRDPPGFQVISSISTIQAANALVGWLPVFHSTSQTIDMQFCASKDGGQTWWRPERRSAVQFKELGYYGGGMMWPYRLFVPDRDDPTKLHAYFSGCQGRHSDIHSTLPGERFAAMKDEWVSNGAWGYSNIKSDDELYSPIKGTNWFRGALMRATWDATRLWALVPAAGGDIPGQAITKEKDGVKGQKVFVNVKVHNQTRTKELGNVAVEVIDTTNGKPVPGFTLADCIPVNVDTKKGAITWKGGDAIPVDAVKLRFVLLRARLYSYVTE